VWNICKPKFGSSDDEKPRIAASGGAKVTGKGGVLGSSRGARALDAGEASVLAVPDMRSSWSEKKLYKVAWSPDHVLSR
jgi:hypothetical protein